MKKIFCIVFALIILGLTGCTRNHGYYHNRNSDICQDYILKTQDHSQCPRPDQHLQIKNGWAMCKCGRQIPVEVGG